MKFLALVSFIIFVFGARSHAKIAYYGENFYKYQLHTSSPQLPPQTAKNLIQFILHSYHQTIKGAPDKIYQKCPHDTKCYRQKLLDYSKEARPLVMGEIHSFPDTIIINSGKTITTPYCKSSYKVYKRDGRYIIPPHTEFNVEHTFPQRRFNPKIHKGLQKSDLHNLWPVYSKVNSMRSSFDFGDLPGQRYKISFCPISSFGSLPQHGFLFEPPSDHKGNVARAALYFALRYDRPLSPEEIETYQAWNKLDPVDKYEKERVKKIFFYQHNRNPFIDYPHLVDYFINGNAF